MSENTEISERVLKVIDFLGVNRSEFGKKLGYNRSQSVYDIINGKSKPSMDFFEKILNSEYSEIISLEWIITGRGNMTKTYEIPNTEEDVNLKDLVKAQKKIIEYQEKEISNQKKEIERLKKHSSDQDLLYRSVAEPIEQLKPKK